MRGRPSDVDIDYSTILIVIEDYSVIPIATHYYWTIVIHVDLIYTSAIIDPNMCG